MKFDDDAGIAQLVEHDLAKVGVASSSLVSRSKFSDSYPRIATQIKGALAEWPCNGLQIRLPRFDSGTRLQFTPCPGGEIGRHKGFKIPRLMAVRVQVPPRAPYSVVNKNELKQSNISNVVTAQGRFFCARNIAYVHNLSLRLAHGTFAHWPAGNWLLSFHIGSSIRANRTFGLLAARQGHYANHHHSSQHVFHIITSCFWQLSVAFKA